MPYTLLNDGDDFEKHYWNRFLGTRFPTYETYWADKIVPLTNRPVDIHFKNSALLLSAGYNAEDVCKAQLHYTILRHLARSFEILQHLKNANHTIGDIDSLSEGLFHLGAGQDVAFEFLQRITTPQIYDPWSPNRRASTSGTIGSQEACAEWKRNNNHPLRPIREYRNHLAHGRMSPARISTTLNKIEVPKIGMEIKYLDWRTVTDQYHHVAVVPSEFDTLDNILESAWNETIDYMETNWQSIV